MMLLSKISSRFPARTLTLAGNALLTLCLLGATGCGGSDSDAGSPGAGGEGSEMPSDEELTGTFTFAGVTTDCKVSTQDFPATGEYSVLCEEDSASSRFVQITFKDEASARMAQDLKLIAPFAFKPEDHPDADTIAVSYTDSDGTLDSDDDSTGSAKVAASSGHYVLTLKDVSLSTVSSEDTGEVSATIQF